jgi:hypothetical protein
VGEPDALLTVAEVALGLAGFSGVVAVFGRPGGGWADADRFRLTVLLNTSISALLLALVGVGLALAGLGNDALAGVSSGLMLATGIVSWAVLRPQQKRFREQYRDAPGMRTDRYRVLVFGGSAINLVAQLVNLLGFPFGRHFSVFFFGLVWLLFMGLLQFVRVLFIRPPDDRSPV